MDLKREIAALEPRAQDELTTFLFQLKLRRDPEHAREMARRRDDRRPESWVRLEDSEAARAPQAPARNHDLREFLEREIWPQIPASILDKPLSKSEREEILGYGPEGV
jgi:hypothetical protein